MGAWLFQRLRIPQVVGYIAIAQLIGDKIAALMKRPAIGVIWLTVMGLLALEDFPV